MPPVLAPARVLVTGANGYLGAWLVDSLIEHGYKVQGTVRSSDKGEAIKKALGEAASSFEYVIVDDVLKVCSPQPR